MIVSDTASRANFFFIISLSYKISHLQVVEFHEVIDGVSSHSPKNRVLFRKPIAPGKSDEELASVRVGFVCLVCTRNQRPPAELKPRMKLVLKRASIDRLSTCKQEKEEKEALSLVTALIQCLLHLVFSN